MTNEELAKFAVARPFFPGVDIQTRLVRHYPYSDLAAHVIGYVSRINETELKELPIAEYRGSTHIGKLGIETSYETQLHGKTGYAEIETNVQARLLNTLKEVNPYPCKFHQTGSDQQKKSPRCVRHRRAAPIGASIKTGAHPSANA